MATSDREREPASGGVVGRGIALAEAGRVPDAIVRFAIRRIVALRAREEARTARSAREFARAMRAQPVLTHAAEANRQHYEVPAELFERVLGPRLKYSCAWFADDHGDLARAEEEMLALTCERAGLEDGMRVLDLGCGWGSLSTFVAERFPRARVLAVSNSRTQRAFLLDRCAKRGLANVEVRTADAALLELPAAGFDRVVSVEMFEHVRDWHALYARIARWLAPDGRFFQHVFCHRAHPYRFEDEGGTDWMARNFFSGGIMPSFDLPEAVGGALAVEARWRVSGTHYARTAEAWLARADAQRDALRRVLAAAGGADVDAARALQRWRMFFMACAELFAFRDGEEWLVGHYLLRPTERRA